MTTIAFLGLGAMGSRMAARLLEAGLPVSVWNRTPAAAAPLLGKGARLAASPAEAVRGADVVISMVTDDRAARQVWLADEAGAISALAEGALAIEASTVSPGWVFELAAAVERRGGAFIDAPVAGSRPQAEAGQLIFMAGGEAAAVERARPVLAPMGARVLHVGTVGQGATLKLAVNALFAAQLASVAELLGFLSRKGLAPEAAADLLTAFPIVAPPVAGAIRMMAARSLAPLFTVDLIEKDLGYVVEAAAAAGASLPTAAAARQAFRRAQAAGLGQSNVSGLAAIFD